MSGTKVTELTKLLLGVLVLIICLIRKLRHFIVRRMSDFIVNV